jgi:hypothetical protein
LKGSSKFNPKNSNGLNNLAKYFSTLSNHKSFQAVVPAAKAGEVVLSLKK